MNDLDVLRLADHPNIIKFHGFDWHDVRPAPMRSPVEQAHTPHPTCGPPSMPSTLSWNACSATGRSSARRCDSGLQCTGAWRQSGGLICERWGAGGGQGQDHPRAGAAVVRVCGPLWYIAHDPAGVVTHTHPLPLPLALLYLKKSLRTLHRDVKVGRGRLCVCSNSGVSSFCTSWAVHRLRPCGSPATSCWAQTAPSISAISAFANAMCENTRQEPVHPSPCALRIPNLGHALASTASRRVDRTVPPSRPAPLSAAMASFP